MQKKKALVLAISAALAIPGVALAQRGGGSRGGDPDWVVEVYGDEISFLGVSSGNFPSTSAIYRRFGFGTSSAARFHERAQNATQYESPNIGGFDFKAQYSTSETDTASPPRHPHFWSFGAKYEMGPVTFFVAHEIHFDLFGGSNNVPAAMRNLTDPLVRSKDRATALAANLKFGIHSFEFDYNWKEWKETSAIAAGRFQSYKNNGMIALWAAPGS